MKACLVVLLFMGFALTVSCADTDDIYNILTLKGTYRKGNLILVFGFFFSLQNSRLNSVLSMRNLQKISSFV